VTRIWKGHLRKKKSLPEGDQMLRGNGHLFIGGREGVERESASCNGVCFGGRLEGNKGNGKDPALAAGQSKL